MAKLVSGGTHPTVPRSSAAQSLRRFPRPTHRPQARRPPNPAPGHTTKSPARDEDAAPIEATTCSPCGKLSANLLPLTVSERVAHACLATLRRADRWNGCRLYRSDRRDRDGANGGWTNRGHIDRTLTKRLHLSIDTLAQTPGIRSFGVDCEEEKRAQHRANSTANTMAHGNPRRHAGRTRSGRTPIPSSRNAPQCQRSISAGTSFSRGNVCSVIDVRLHWVDRCERSLFVAMTTRLERTGQRENFTSAAQSTRR
jgi:hypothetical protein